MSIRRRLPLRPRMTLVGLAARLATRLRAVAAARWAWRGTVHAGVTHVNIMTIYPFDAGTRPLEHAEMLHDQCVIVAHLFDCSGKGDAARIQQHDVVGEIEGQLYVLLDEQDRLARLL